MKFSPINFLQPINPSVDSNDKLYAGDETFVTELNSFGSKVLNEILDCLADVQNEQVK